jgi:predicted TIM-barrel fold metal-dependent hydrolase
MEIIDAHLHVWVTDDPKYPIDGTLMAPPKASAPVELLFEHMKANGIERAVLVQPSHYAYDNRYLADCLDRYPGVLAGVALVDPVPADAPDRLRHWIEDRGIRGVRLHPHRTVEADAWLYNGTADPFWETAVGLDIPVCFLMVPSNAAAIRRAVERFPDATIVIDHFGSPDKGEGTLEENFRTVAQLAEHPRAYCKVSGFPVASKTDYPHEDTHILAEIALDAFGPQRLMWGTDFPHIIRRCGYDRCLALTRDLLGLSDADREWILGRTARTLWFS